MFHIKSGKSESDSSVACVNKMRGDAEPLLHMEHHFQEVHQSPPVLQLACVIVWMDLSLETRSDQWIFFCHEQWLGKF